ncbi:fatty acid desaturase family protein [Parafrankia sp. FMc2]|uniref:fatty acid desaturase family protein n=1 Tax=Parafrankia sp. FMc2 TaxID=3233196 RepID=UPI0034D72C76
METVRFSRSRVALRDAGLLRVSDVKGLATVLGECLLLVAIAWGLHRTSPWSPAFLALEVLAGISVFRWFVILHESGHRSLFTRVGANSVSGHLGSVFCLIPYYSWRHIHFLHHRWVGVIDKDPTQAHLLALWKAGRVQNTLFRLVWRLWLPIPFIKFLFEVFWGYPVRPAGIPGHKPARGWFSNAVCVVPHVTAAAVVGPAAWATYFLPMLVVFYVVIENMNLPQHSELFPFLSDAHPAPVPFAEQDAFTRSTHLPDWLGVALALNFNRHTEHHLFPGVPWYSLNKARRHLRGEGYRQPFEVPFLGFMWRLRRRDPIEIFRDALPRPLPAGRAAGPAMVPSATASPTTASPTTARTAAPARTAGELP